MSYFPIETNKMINEKNNMLEMTQEIPKKNNAAAHHTQPHTPQAKRRISEAQTKRYEIIRQLVKGQQQLMTEDRVNEICREVLNEYLNHNAMPLKNNNQINYNSL